SLQPDSQDELLSFGLPPSTAIHHPKEIRLYPTHPRILEIATERTVLDRKAGNAGTVRLVDDDRLVIELCKDGPARLWPTFHLLGIRGGFKHCCRHVSPPVPLGPR